MADVNKVRIKMTNAEFLALPESMERIELIDGELIRQEEDDMATPKQPHQRYVLRVAVLLDRLPGETVISPMNVILAEGVIVEPDVFWINPEDSACQLGENRWYYGAPDLVVEVLSPSTKKFDRGRKFDLYEQYGVREYWIIDSEMQTIEVYRRENGRLMRVGLFDNAQTFAFGLLPDVTISVAEIFR